MKLFHCRLGHISLIYIRRIRELDYRTGFHKLEGALFESCDPCRSGHMNRPHFGPKYSLIPDAERENRRIEYYASIKPGEEYTADGFGPFDNGRTPCMVYQTTGYHFYLCISSDTLISFPIKEKNKCIKEFNTVLQYANKYNNKKCTKLYSDNDSVFVAMRSDLEKKGIICPESGPYTSYMELLREKYALLKKRLLLCWNVHNYMLASGHWLWHMLFSSGIEYQEKEAHQYNASRVPHLHLTR
jgi:hypothetical protein